MKHAYSRGMTIAEAARALEIPEHAVKARIADGSIRVVGKGPFKAHLLNVDDVKHLARIHELGTLGRRQRLVFVVGELPDHAQALRVAGLTVERAGSILHALDAHDVAGASIIVATPEAVNEALWMISGNLGAIHLAIITDDVTGVPWPLELSTEMLDPYELRELVRWAWRVLDLRTCAGRLKL